MFNSLLVLENYIFNNIKILIEIYGIIRILLIVYYIYGIKKTTYQITYYYVQLLYLAIFGLLLEYWRLNLFLFCSVQKLILIYHMFFISIFFGLLCVTYYSIYEKSQTVIIIQLNKVINEIFHIFFLTYFVLFMVELYKLNFFCIYLKKVNINNIVYFWIKAIQSFSINNIKIDINTMMELYAIICVFFIFIRYQKIIIFIIFLLFIFLLIIAAWMLLMPIDYNYQKIILLLHILLQLTIFNILWNQSYKNTNDKTIATTNIERHIVFVFIVYTISVIISFFMELAKVFKCIHG